MSGLMQKDLCLLLQRSRSMVILAGVGVLMGFSTDGVFVIGYLTMICAILTIGTISYDEFDNGYLFLLTLPITKRTYVFGKFLFCLLGGLMGWILSVAIFIACSMIKGNTFDPSDLVEGIAFLPVLGLMIAFMLPMQLKYGAEKSRVAIAVVGGGIWALAYFGMKLLPDSIRIPAFLSALDGFSMIAILLAACLGAIAVSCLVSLRIMEKKEF